LGNRHIDYWYRMDWLYWAIDFGQSIANPRKALFHTRREARDWLRRYKGADYVAYPDAKVVQVMPQFAILKSK